MFRPICAAGAPSFAPLALPKNTTLSGGALLGSPLSCDFAVVSLSNLLTPQETIEARLRAAASGDLALALYNPMSRNRPCALSRACSVLLESLPAERPCGYVRNIGRSGQSTKVCTLLELRSAALDMFCTAFVGSSCTKCVMRGGHEYLVTERGYLLLYMYLKRGAHKCAERQSRRSFEKN